MGPRAALCVKVWGVYDSVDVIIAFVPVRACVCATCDCVLQSPAGSTCEFYVVLSVVSVTVTATICRCVVPMAVRL